MNTLTTDYMTLVEVLELTDSAEAYASAVGALVRRVEAEGPEGVVTYQFYTDPDSGEAGAIITFADPRAIGEHMARISDWPEFLRFARTAKLVDLRIYGVLSPEGEEWMARGSFRANKTFAGHVAGFVRG